MRLNGWQRIGIVASVLWAVGGGLWGSNIRIHEGDWTFRNLTLCYKYEKDHDACEREFQKDYATSTSHQWVYAAVVGLVPIPIVWLLVYGLVGVVRWVRRGFG